MTVIVETAPQAPRYIEHPLGTPVRCERLTDDALLRLIAASDHLVVCTVDSRFPDRETRQMAHALARFHGERQHERLVPADGEDDLEAAVTLARHALRARAGRAVLAGAARRRLPNAEARSVAVIALAKSTAPACELVVELD